MIPPWPVRIFQCMKNVITESTIWQAKRMPENMQFSLIHQFTTHRKMAVVIIALLTAPRDNPSHPHLGQIPTHHRFSSSFVYTISRYSPP